MDDIRGVEFEPGDRVAVAMRQGSSVWLEIRVVSHLDNGTPVFVCKDGKKRKYAGTCRALLNVDGIDS